MIDNRAECISTTRADPEKHGACNACGEKDLPIAEVKLGVWQILSFRICRGCARELRHQLKPERKRVHHAKGRR